MSLLLDALKKAAQERAERDRKQAEDITRHQDQTQTDISKAQASDQSQTTKPAEETEPEKAQEIESLAPESDETELDLSGQSLSARSTLATSQSPEQPRPFAEIAEDTALDFNDLLGADERRQPLAAEPEENESDSTETRLELDSLSLQASQPTEDSAAETASEATEFKPDDTHLDFKLDAEDSEAPASMTSTSDNDKPEPRGKFEDTIIEFKDDTRRSEESLILSILSQEQMRDDTRLTLEHSDPEPAKAETSAPQDDSVPAKLRADEDETQLTLGSTANSTSDTTSYKLPAADDEAFELIDEDADEDMTELKLDPGFLDEPSEIEPIATESLLYDDDPSQVRHPHRPHTPEDDTSMVLHEEDVTSFFGDENGLMQPLNDGSNQEHDIQPAEPDSADTDLTRSGETTARYETLDIQDEDDLMATLRKEPKDFIDSDDTQSASERTDTFSLPPDLKAWQIERGMEETRTDTTDPAAYSGESSSTGIDIESLTDAQLATTYVSQTERATEVAEAHRAPDNYDRTVLKLPKDITRDLEEVKADSGPKILTSKAAKKVFQSKSNYQQRKNYRLYLGLGLIVILSLAVFGVYMYLVQSDQLGNELVRYQRDPAPPKPRTVPERPKAAASVTAPSAAELIAEAEGLPLEQVKAQTTTPESSAIVLPNSTSDTTPERSTSSTPTPPPNNKVPNVAQLEQLAEGSNEQEIAPSQDSAEPVSVVPPAAKPEPVAKAQPPQQEPEPEATPVAPANTSSAAKTVATSRPTSKVKSSAPVKTLPQQAPIAVKPEEQKADPVSAQLDQAYAAYRSSDLSQARELYTQALQQEPQNLDAMLGLAAIDVLQQRYTNAINRYQQVLQQEPGHVEAQTALVSLLPMQPEQAEARLRLLLQQNPNAGFIRFNLGNTLAGQKRWAEAQQQFFEALSTEPGNSDYAYNLAVSLEQLGKSRAAIPYYRQALASYQAELSSFNAELVRQRLELLEQQ